MLIIAGTVRVAPERLEEAREAMRAMIDASRAEPGCLGYAYAQDVLDAGLVHVSEAWIDRAALDLHFASPHLKAWRGAWGELGLHDRRLTLHEVSASQPL